MATRFISSDEIFNHNFDKNYCQHISSNNLQTTADPSIADIEIWEEIYYEPGIIGVYAAWDPYCEFYLVYYPILSETNFHSLTFLGVDASDKVQKLLAKYDIQLVTYNIWIDELTKFQ
jgi:thiol-disulfide isomerase/thioredoxin